MRWAEIASLEGSVRVGPRCQGLERHGRWLTIRGALVAAQRYIVAEVNVCEAGRLARPVLAIDLGGLTVVNRSWVLRHTAALDTMTSGDLARARRSEPRGPSPRHGGGRPNRARPVLFQHFAT